MVAEDRERRIYDDEFFEGIGISDDLMFRDVFGEDEELAGKLLSLALGRDVGKVEYVHGSHELRPEWDARMTTFDVYLRTEEGGMGDMEMQNSHRSELPLRLRTHLSNIDRDAIVRGDKYTDARESAVVFVCTFDPLGDGLLRYTVRRHVEETGKAFPDRQVGVLLNATGTEGEVDPTLALFLRYVAGYDDGEVMGDDFVRRVDERVRARRADWKWRRSYMTWQEKLEDIRAEGREEGREEGRAEGREEGRAEGREEGLVEGRAEARAEAYAETVAKLADMVSRGLVAASEVSACFGIPEEELLRAMQA